jgi:hypothetical protein
MRVPLLVAGQQARPMVRDLEAPRVPRAAAQPDARASPFRGDRALAERLTRRAGCGRVDRRLMYRSSAAAHTVSSAVAVDGRRAKLLRPGPGLTALAEHCALRRLPGSRLAYVRDDTSSFW